jgi:hypothetical protein
MRVLFTARQYRQTAKMSSVVEAALDVFAGAATATAEGLAHVS